MTKTSTFVSLVLLCSVAACAKGTDLGKMQEETIARVKIYVAELDVLQRRHADVASVENASPDATKRLGDAGTAINHGRTLAASAPTMVATAAKSGNPEELIKVHDTTIAALEHDIRIAKQALEAFEINTTLHVAAAPRGNPTPPATPDTPVSNDGHDHGSAPPGGTQAGHTTDIACTMEIALQCPDGQIDGCLKQPPVGTTHACVPK